jgi:hypothetical protein
MALKSGRGGSVPHQASQHASVAAASAKVTVAHFIAA